MRKNSEMSSSGMSSRAQAAARAASFCVEGIFADATLASVFVVLALSVTRLVGLIIISLIAVLAYLGVYRRQGTQDVF